MCGIPLNHSNDWITSVVPGKFSSILVFSLWEIGDEQGEVLFQNYLPHTFFLVLGHGQPLAAAYPW